MSVDDLHNKIKQKLGFLTSSVETLQQHQERLQENSKKAKIYVHASCDRDTNRLKVKERSLLQQLEVITENQKRLFECEIAKLLQIKGSLCATQKILRECQFEDLSALTCLYDGYVTSLDGVEGMGKLSVEELIESAVVSLKELNLPEKIDPDSASFGSLLRLEDYTDSETNIFKTHAEKMETVVGAVGPSIQVEFPKMPAGVWLAKPPSENCQMKDSKRGSGYPSEGKLSQEDMSAWLADLRMSEECSDGCRLGGSFEILNNEGVSSALSKKTKSRCSSFSSSIEVVPSLDMEKEMACFPLNNFGNAKSCWLSISQTNNRKLTNVASMPIDVEEFACQANEPCNSYNDCLCKGYCKDLAKERALQTSRWLLKNDLTAQKASSPFGEEPLRESPHPTGIKRKLSPLDGENEIVKHMRGILSSDQNKWLVTSGSNKSPNPESNPGQNVNILYKPRSESWLKNLDKSSELKVPDNNSGIEYSPHSNVWLLHKLKEQRKREQYDRNRTVVEEVNQEHHENNNSRVSVSDLQGALAELSVLLPKYSSPPSTTGEDTHSNSFSMHSHAASVLTHNINYLYRNDFDLSRKLKWLSRPHSMSPGSQPGLNCLPNSLLVLAERNLDKWLMNRL